MTIDDHWNKPSSEEAMLGEGGFGSVSLEVASTIFDLCSSKNYGGGANANKKKSLNRFCWISCWISWHWKILPVAAS